MSVFIAEQGDNGSTTTLKGRPAPRDKRQFSHLIGTDIARCPSARGWNWRVVLKRERRPQTRRRPPARGQRTSWDDWGTSLARRPLAGGRRGLAFHFSLSLGRARKWDESNAAKRHNNAEPRQPKPTTTERNKPSDHHLTGPRGENSHTAKQRGAQSAEQQAYDSKAGLDLRATYCDMSPVAGGAGAT